MAVTARGPEPESEEVFGSARISPAVQTIHSRRKYAPRRRWLQLGLSIVETIVVAGLISTVLLFAIGLIPSFKFSNRRASMELQASTLAQSALENARAAKYSDLVSTNTQTTLDGVTYFQDVQVTPDASGITKDVRVVVTWSWQNKNYEIFRESVLCRVPRG